jgi:carbamoyl-phosphate synthase large subunit
MTHGDLRILVSAVGGDLGQSVIKCLRASSYPVRIAGCDVNRYAAGRADADEFFQGPPASDEPAYRAFLQQIFAGARINYFIPLSETEIDFFNDQRDWFAGQGVTVLANEKWVIETFRDKWDTIDFFRSRGIAHPRTWKAEDYRGQLGFPVILKRRRGSGGQGTFLARDGADMDFFLRRHPDAIVQEYLPGEDNEYTAGLFSDGHLQHVIVFRRRLSAGGFSQQVELVEDPQILQLPLQIAQAMDFRGSVNVQFRQTGNGCLPFEVNPRFSSTVYFRHLFGFTDVAWMLDLHEGRPIRFCLRRDKTVGVRKIGEVMF